MNVADYTSAVGAYRRTFPNKQQQIEQTPDPAVREMLLNMERRGIETVFDRFDSQQPQSVFGMAGICCKNCFMGPCKITKRSPRGSRCLLSFTPRSTSWIFPYRASRR